jgi:hypothetical protein
VNYGADAAYFRSASDPPTSQEWVKSDLFGLYLTASMLWGIHLHRMFEIQIGAAIGVGYIGGNLWRSQAYPSDGNGSGPNWSDCQVPGGPGGAHFDYCDPTQSNHFSYGQPPGTTVGGTRTQASYSEPGIFSGGSVPTLIPWISLPQVSLHFRPHRYFDIRADGGFAIIGFYGGASVHVIF